MSCLDDSGGEGIRRCVEVEAEGRGRGEFLRAFFFFFFGKEESDS